MCSSRLWECHFSLHQQHLPIAVWQASPHLSGYSPRWPPMGSPPPNSLLPSPPLPCVHCSTAVGLHQTTCCLRASGTLSCLFYTPNHQHDVGHTVNRGVGRTGKDADRDGHSARLRAVGLPASGSPASWGRQTCLGTFHHLIKSCPATPTHLPALPSS